MRAQVRDVHILTHADTGNPRGSFVEFGTAEEVGIAVSRDGSVRSPARTRRHPPRGVPNGTSIL